MSRQPFLWPDGSRAAASCVDIFCSLPFLNVRQDFLKHENRLGKAGLLATAVNFAARLQLMRIQPLLRWFYRLMLQ